MEAKVEQTPATNTNPVLSVDKNGFVLYSNEAGNLLLNEWGVEVGEKLPPYIEDFVQTVISKNSPEKMDVKVGNRIYLVVFSPLSEEQHLIISGFDISDQTNLERKLRESEEEFAEIQNMAHVGNWVWDIKTDKAYWSNELYRIFGRDPQKLAPTIDEFHRYIHPDDRHDYVNLADKALNERSTLCVDFRIISDDGEERTIHMQSEIIFDEKNCPVRIKGIVQDITERKKANEKIERLANIIEYTNDGIGLITPEGIVLEWNKGEEHIYGYDMEDIVGRHISVLSPPHMKNEPMDNIELVKQTHISFNYSASRMRKDGKTIDVSITLAPVFDSHGKLTAISFITRDITEQKMHEEKLRESEEKYRNIVETANEGIALINSEGVITFANKKMADMLGYSVEEIVDRTVWDFVEEEQKTTVTTKFDGRHKDSNYDTFEFKLKRKDGSPLWVLISSKAFFDKDGKFKGSLNLHTDITKRKEAEEALNYIEIARKKEIHHRIKNNLQVISSLLDLQAEKFKGKKDIKDSQVLDAFKESQDRVISMALIHEELHKGGELDALNFSTYIKELADNLFLTYRLGNEGISLDMDIEEDILFDLDTAVPLGIIINELLSNSLKYAFPDRDKGEIRIKLHREETIKRKKLNYKNSVFALSLSDNGVGIPEDLNIEDLDSLGLQLVTSLVDQLEGELELKRNNGTEFIIRFTAIEESNKASAPQQLVDK
jgi:PAS domain S-box-containing protein